MGNYADAPDYVVVEFLRPSGSEVKLVELGGAYLLKLHIKSEDTHKPFCMAVPKQRSSKDNAFYNHKENAVPLPDGLQTLVKVQNVIIPMGEIDYSKKNNPQRSGVAQIQLGKTVYEVTAYITQTKHPFYIYLIVRKAASKGSITT